MEVILRQAVENLGKPGDVVKVSNGYARNFLLPRGVAFEAIHQAGGLGTPIVVVLNDNGMSISPNVGALSRYFNRVRLNPKLWHAREGAEQRLTELPGGIGSRFERLGPQLKESIKAFWAPGLFWEELDWAYMGVIDGHDTRALRRALRSALSAERPVVVHIATVKGKGFAPAEDGGLEGMEKWHAAKPKSIANRAPAPSRPAPPGAPSAPPQYTQVFGDAIVEEVRRDRRVVGITAAMNSGTGLNVLQKAEPAHYFDVGIAEQQAILFAAGLALHGAKPVAAIYSTFLQRAFDQIVHDVCLQKLNVVFAMDRAGLVGDDGPTHHGVFDIAYMRALPNMVCMAPRDEAMLPAMLRTALTYDDGPICLRYPRGEGVGVTVPPPAELQAIEIGKGEVLREGSGVALIGYGTGVQKALEAADLLSEHDVDVTVADARFAKPIDAAIGFLQDRADASRKQMSLFGLAMDADTVGILGPLSVAALLVFLLAHVRHLASLDPHDEFARTYPWICLSTDWLGIALTFSTVVLLPAAASAALVVRALANLREAGRASVIIPGAMTVVVVTLSILTFSAIRTLRRRLAALAAARSRERLSVPADDEASPFP